jgi:SAM-dependent methyltransferase
MSTESRNSVGGHWPELARRWEQVGPPLRPSTEDLAAYTAAISGWARDHGPPRGLILGVTPELYRLQWPAGADVLAIDHTQDMIDALWPGSRDAVVCADWMEMPLQTGSRDIVLCDGGLHLLSFPHGQCRIVRELHRVLCSNGLCIFRLYVPPPQCEAPEDVLEDLLAGRISNLNILKLRLGMALQQDVAQGVQLASVWDAVHSRAPDFHALAARLGWPTEHLMAINTYRDCPSHYHFSNVAQVRVLFCEDPGGFELESIHAPAYELGERCPTIVFRVTEATLRSR